MIPIPDTGADQVTVVDAGDVLRSLTKSKVDLVLCGHRHRPRRWKVENTLVVHAGSVSCNKMRGFLQLLQCGNHEKRKDRRKLIIVGGDYLDFNEIVRRREIIQESDIFQHSDGGKSFPIRK